MPECKLTEVEGRFVELIWAREPIGSGELVRLCEKELRWKKSTTYTELRRLCDKGFLRSEGSVVTSILKKDEFYARQSEEFVAETFAGSLPRFIVAFTRNKRLSEHEIDELERLIQAHREG